MDCFSEEKGCVGRLSVEGGEICDCSEEVGELVQGEEREERVGGGEEGVGGVDMVVVCWEAIDRKSVV